MKTYSSGTKPRFDGKGSLFGDLHRNLPSGTCMLDLDRMLVTVIQELWLREEDKVFVEYRHKAEEIIFTAIFEIKHKYIESAFDIDISANRARIAMSRKLECRLFVVICNQGKPPLEFYEIDLDTGIAKLAYTLTYSQNNKADAVIKCWQSLGLID